MKPRLYRDERPPGAESKGKNALYEITFNYLHPLGCGVLLKKLVAGRLDMLFAVHRQSQL
jgi:hypothetical protein